MLNELLGLRPRTGGERAIAIAVANPLSYRLRCWVTIVLRRSRRRERGNDFLGSCEGYIDFFLGEIFGSKEVYPLFERGTCDGWIL